jgi:acyl-coenzyme A synthetase/AMP-(fatty) acid ligase
VAGSSPDVRLPPGLCENAGDQGLGDSPNDDAVAFVVMRPEAAVGAAELDRLCLSEIARFNRPKAYRFVDALPKNNYGKVLKTELRKMLG